MHKLVNLITAGQLSENQIKFSKKQKKLLFATEHFEPPEVICPQCKYRGRGRPPTKAKGC